MPANDLEVFDHLRSDDETNIETGYLTYAVFALKKKRWINRFQELHGIAPVQAEVDNWIAHLSPYEFDTMRSEAVDFFDTAATDYMQDAIARARQEGSNEAISQSVV